ncbi:MAG: hypothetical protein V7K89_05685 [Nostoc sp.]|uniref:hypothetical protein n=1 Tax=Nostoc sp. TaxID=1180 RepID=UPI002FF8619E
MFIDTFLISCRALGRGVEQSFLRSIFDFATQKNLTKIIAPYSSSSRNEQVKAFLLNIGFLQKQSDILEAEVAIAPKKPEHVKILVRLPELV